MNPGKREAMTQVGERLHEVRKARGETMRAVAERAGINPTTLGHVEKGHYMPSRQTLTNLARALDIDEVALLALAGYVLPGGIEDLQEKNPLLGKLATALFTTDIPEPVLRRVLRLIQTKDEEWVDDLSKTLLQIAWGTRSEEPQITVFFADLHTFTVAQVHTLLRHMQTPEGEGEVTS